MFSVLLFAACGDKAATPAGDSGVNHGGDDGGSASDGGDSDGGAGDDTGDTDEPVSFNISDVQAEVSEHIVTVVRVTWTTSEPTRGYVAFGDSAALGLTSNLTDEGTTHEVLLLGNTADTDVHFEVHAAAGSSSELSGGHSITTGSLPSGLPVLSVSGEADQWSYQVVPLQGTAYVVAIVDPQGRYIWYDQLDATGNVMRAWLSADRESMILCLAGSQDRLQDGRVVWVSLDGAERREVAFPYVDHDLTELPDGTLAAIVVTGPPEGVGDEHMQADKIVELYPDGTFVDIWNAWTDLGVDLETVDMRGHNWTHANGLDYYEDDDVYYLSMKEQGTIAKIDRATGTTQWLLNGRLNQFEFDAETEIVQMQHQFDRVDGGLLIFDNGDQSRGYSRAVELELDESLMKATEVWEYIRDPAVYVFAKGDVARFADGSSQVVWSSSGEIQNVTPEGDVTWQLNTDLGQAITFVQVLDDLYLRD